MQTAERATICPYRGLQVFREEDAAFFFGRKAFAKKLLDYTLGKDLVAVVGPSGSGKSSVVQAGLLPLLRRERPPAHTWDAVSFTPGNDPFHRLASALIPLLESELSETDRLTEAEKLGKVLASGEAKLEAAISRVIEKSNGTGRLFLVADQFEEFFTLTPEPVRRPFAQALLRALRSAPFTLLATLRADFYSQIIALDRELSDRLASAQVNLGALTQDELRESITAPARLLGLEFEPGLAERILADVGSEPGHLPLVEFALTELWRRPEGNRLVNRAYDEIGGATGALAQRAEDEFGRLKPEEQTAARRLFSRLVRVAKPEEAGEDTRPRADLSDAETVTRYVANRLANARLLVTGGETGKGTLSVEVAHEALIRNWERLRGWLNEDREFLLWRQRLQVQVKEWEERGRDVDYLLRGTPLSEAERWLLGRPQDLTDPGQKFIRESIALRQHEHAEDEKHRQAEIENAKRLKEAAEARADVERELAEKARALAREQMERAEVERSSVKAAEEAKEAERARREARIVELENNRRKQRRLILIIAAVALIALALGVVALFGRRTAIEQKKLADDRLQNMHKMLEAIPEPEVKERLTLLYFSAEVKTLSRAQKTRLAIEIQRRASTTYAKPRVPAEYGLKLWTAGSTLRVRFLGGTEEQRNLVRETAPEWSKYANLKFEFGNDADAELRVTFDPSGGSWAYVGVEALGIPRDQPTINLGFVETGNTLHEFGHVLGLIHEHQSPNANLLWDRQKVYAYFKATQGWTKQEVDTGVFTRFQEIEYRPLDSDSIMMYYFPGEMFTDGVARGGKQALSKSDKEFGGKLYPFKWPEAVHFQRFPIRTPHRTQHRHPAFHEQTRQIRFGFSVMSRIASSRAQKIVCHVCAPG